MNDTDRARWEAVEEAVELLHEDRIDDALPLLRAAVEKDPGNVYAHFHLGTALAGQGKHGPALAALTEAERREPAYLGAVIARMWVLHDMDRFAEAARAGERALSLRAEDADALWGLAVVYAELGERAKALDCVERFLKTNPTVEARHEAEALRSTLWGKAKPLASE